MMPRNRKALLPLIVLLAGCGFAQTPDEARWQKLREEMVRGTIAEPADRPKRGTA